MANDAGFGSDGMGISAGAAVLERGREMGHFKVEKWDIDHIAYARRKLDLDRPPEWEPSAREFNRLKLKPFEVYEKRDCNLLTAAGWAIGLNSKSYLATGSNTTVWWTAAVGRIGLGTSGTTPTYADAALGSIGALTTPNWVLCGVAPTYTAASGGTGPFLTLTATFITTAANGAAILEFGTDQGTANTLSVTPVGVFVNHGLASPGTKTASQTWNVTVTLQFT